jgi:hypothetical protein
MFAASQVARSTYCSQRTPDSHCALSIASVSASGAIVPPPVSSPPPSGALPLPPHAATTQHTRRNLMPRC